MHLTSAVQTLLPPRRDDLVEEDDLGYTKQDKYDFLFWEYLRQSDRRALLSRQRCRLAAAEKAWNETEFLSWDRQKHLMPVTSIMDYPVLQPLFANPTEAQLVAAEKWKRNYRNAERVKAQKKADNKPAKAPRIRHGITQGQGAPGSTPARKAPEKLDQVYPTATVSVRANPFLPQFTFIDKQTQQAQTHNSTFPDIVNLFTFVCQLENGPFRTVLRSVFHYCESLPLKSPRWEDFGVQSNVKEILRQLAQQLQEGGKKKKKVRLDQGVATSSRTDVNSFSACRESQPIHQSEQTTIL